MLSRREETGLDVPDVDPDELVRWVLTQMTAGRFQCFVSDQRAEIILEGEYSGPVQEDRG